MKPSSAEGFTRPPRLQTEMNSLHFFARSSLGLYQDPHGDTIQAGEHSRTPRGLPILSSSPASPPGECAKPWARCTSREEQPPNTSICRVPFSAVPTTPAGTFWLEGELLLPSGQSGTSLLSLSFPLSSASPPPCQSAHLSWWGCPHSVPPSPGFSAST